MKKKTFISAVFSAAILMSAAVIAANAGAADVAYEPAVNSLTADSTETERKSVAISDSLKDVYSIISVEQPERTTEDGTIACVATEGRTAIGLPITTGDANCDGKVTVADCVAVLQYIANKEKYPLTSEGIANSDVDGIDGISGGDTIAIQKIDAGIADCNYSTKEEFIDLLVAEDPAFSDHGFIYAPGLKYDAVMNIGRYNNTDVLVISGPKYPDDVKEIYVVPENSIYDYSFITWETFFNDDQLNDKDYISYKTHNCFSGGDIYISPLNGAAIRDGEPYGSSGKWHNIRAAVFIEGMEIDGIEGSDKWTVEDFKNYLSQQERIEVPTEAC